MSGETILREINTPEVRQAISAAVHDQVSNEAEATAAAGHVFAILDRASAGLPVDGHTTSPHGPGQA